jgi:arabinosaccharide transport system substrate-binding protein
MPLPAWERGERRTSVWGGTMLAIAKDAPDQDRLWSVAKHLYLSKENATRLYKEGDIVTPVTEFWSDPIYDQPDAYFSGQAPGRMYINLADQVPDRFNSPFAQLASVRLQAAMSELVRNARSTGKTTRTELEPSARELLEVAQADIMRHVRRNRFYAERADAAGGAQ